MNQDRLRLDLAELAEEVTPVDLRDRALRTSRRLGIQRAVATSAAALVVLAAATGTAFAIRPNGDSPAPAPAGPSVTSTWPPVEVTPTPQASREPSTAPSGSPSTDSGTPAGGPTFGRLIYGPAQVSDSPTVRLRSWRPGGGQPTSLAALPEIWALSNASVSPDGRRLAWVERGFDGKDVGKLYVSDIDGSNKKSMASDVDEYCITPTWSPDSRHLLFGTMQANGGYDRAGVLDTLSERHTVQWWSSRPEACHAIWSADGRTIAMNTDAGVALYDTSGRKQRAVPGLSAAGAWQSHQVTSLAPDATRIALFRIRKGMDAGDVGRLLRVNAVLETATGKVVDLPLGGRDLKQVFFQADGSMVVRVEDGDGRVQLLLVDATGRKVAEQPEPAALRDAQLIAAIG
ncbi:PD40 domain-containing protein [Micromonospora chaiyaphumensis]|uniref:WD40-like Beta Propeller Repeat n=1 Tax=Micromonospora chaiyaphumensis TaxID=307119 RepID=A0A1C4XQC9_9ACTN|nr:PD40 domain-containing protein [Micromonospora chaiyaphumensis]SCF10698.1 WD40-like Beta Propeller Repeat [Micromonospora chaiyaphumensis]